MRYGKNNVFLVYEGSLGGGSNAGLNRNISMKPFNQVHGGLSPPFPTVLSYGHVSTGGKKGRKGEEQGKKRGGRYNQTHRDLNWHKFNVIYKVQSDKYTHTPSLLVYF